MGNVHVMWDSPNQSPLLEQFVFALGAYDQGQSGGGHDYPTPAFNLGDIGMLASACLANKLSGCYYADELSYLTLGSPSMPLWSGGEPVSPHVGLPLIPSNSSYTMCCTVLVNSRPVQGTLVCAWRDDQYRFYATGTTDADGLAWLELANTGPLDGEVSVTVSEGHVEHSIPGANHTPILPYEATVLVGHGKWAEMEPLPLGPPPGRAVKSGAWLAYNPVNGLVYAAKGYKTNEFYAYYPGADAWDDRLARIPAGPEGKLPYKGCRGVSDGGNYIYMTKGYNTLGFWRYDIAGDSWQQLANVPLGSDRKRVKGGTDLVYVAASETGWVYLLKGYKTSFYRYNTVSGQWDLTLPNVPFGGGKDKYDEGSFLVYDGGDYLYAHQARYYDRATGFHYMFRYDLGTRSWQTAPLKGMPLAGMHSGRVRNKKSRDGGSAAWYDGCMYALKGGNTQQLFRYNPNGDTWVELDTMPVWGTTQKKKRVKYGGDIAGANGLFYALKGNNTREFWRYLPQYDEFGFGGVAGKGAGGGKPLGGGELPVSEGEEACCPRWSPDGTSVTYYKENGQGYNQIYISSAGVEAQLTFVETDCENPVFSPDGQWIAFQMMDTSTDCYEICKVSAIVQESLPGDERREFSEVEPIAAPDLGHGPNSGDGIGSCPRPWACPAAEPRAVLYAPGQSQEPVAVPVQEHSHNPEVAPASTDNDIIQLTFDGYDHENPEWSPDTSWILCQKDDESGWTQIYRVPASGGDEEQLTFDPADHEWPGWLSDTAVVFQWSRSEEYDQIAKTNTSSHELCQLTFWPYDHEKPSPSPDGSFITFQVLDDWGIYQIGIVSAAGGDERWLTCSDYDLEEPVFGSDNTTVYCVGWAFPGSEIAAIDATSGGYVPVTDASATRDNPDATATSYSPQNSVVYERDQSGGGIFAGRGPRRRKPGTGIFMVKVRRKPGGAMADVLGVVKLDRTAPNPAVSDVTIGWQVPMTMQVSLHVFDITGRRVRMLVNGQTKAGRYFTDWNGKDDTGRRVAAGVYFVRLDTDDATVTEKVVLQR